ncbi:MULTISPECIES: GntR family transcriptional regulator [Virgibacillus]|uniref:HTH-type transcriptional repressor YtrA n=1 Tax=Virgibacillus dokdonensis TaxID=302167 RepID=A0A2K9IVU4_9BACI|nr:MULTISPECIES: GntR family transcriptional regulator [Virgibacillus]AUJ23872.1 HTH-type transcriptional repressor YtrA [Virgibacillus dokdonensis]NWO12328.1 GntR family transcriptional regulator [Virgibacillus sp.]
MLLDTSGMKPIYIQIAEWIEAEILNGNFLPHDKVYSQYTLADMFTINPATAAKGLTLLAEEDILYSKRGLGKFVTPEAKEIIMDRRKNQTLKQLLEDVVIEAEQLKVDEQELMQLLQETIAKRKGRK